MESSCSQKELYNGFLEDQNKKPGRVWGGTRYQSTKQVVGSNIIKLQF